MNIFVTDLDPIISAKNLCDSHIKKMGIESCQILSACFPQKYFKENDCPRNKSGNVRRHFNLNHPSCKWVIKSKSNADWLIKHAEMIFKERINRYPDVNRHFTHDFLDWISGNINRVSLPDVGITQFPVVINENKECRKDKNFYSSNVIEKYRLFIKYDKPFATWIKNKPNWI